MEKIVCPVCETSDFKEENGFYVCQICGHKMKTEAKIAEEQNATKEKKPLDKTISLIFFGYMSASILLSIIPNLNYYISDGISTLIINLICLAPMLAMFISTLKSMKSDKAPTKKFKKFCFFYYLIGRVAGVLLTLALGYFSIVNIIYAVLYVAAVWFVLFKMEKHFNK